MNTIDISGYVEYGLANQNNHESEDNAWNNRVNVKVRQIIVINTTIIVLSLRRNIALKSSMKGSQLVLFLFIIGLLQEIAIFVTENYILHV